MINKRPVLTTINGYKQQLQIPETMKLFGSTKTNSQNKEW